METFSWSDSLRALAAPCLDCLHSSKDERRNDLEDLLADSGSASATTADAETLSLHSNPSSPRRKRARFTKHIRFFGWDLFGRQPIRLPDDDEEDDEENGGGSGGDGGGDGEGQEQEQQRRKKKRRSHRGGHRRPSAISSSTLDSDAAPLDSAAIVSHATNYAEEVKRAERRERRRQRREMKRAAALALEQATVLADGDEFEGFQGSGGGGRHPGLPNSPPPLGRDDGTAHELRYAPNEDDDDGDDDDDDEGDFGAGSYTRRTSGSSESGRGSDSRSRTSATTSVSGQQPTAYQHPHSGHSIQPYNHHYISQQPPADAPLLPVRRTKNKSSRSSASKSSSSSASSAKRSRSSPSAPLSPSLASPVASAVPLPTNTNTTITPTAPPPAPRTAPQETTRGPRLQTVGVGRQSSGFPSPGIGGPRNGKRDMGAFLANRGGF